MHEPNNANVNPAASNALRATRLLGARPRAHVRPEACPPALRCPPGAFTRSEGRKSSSPTSRERILSVLEVCGCLLGGFRFRRQLLLVAAAGILAGCKAVAPAPLDALAAEGSGVVDSSASSHALTRDVLYKLLVGEFASHLGDLTLSLENYLEAARETRDAGVAARAVKIAVMAQDNERALEAGRLWYQFDPSSVEARQVLASLLLRTGDIDAAVEHLDEIVRTMADPPDSGFRRAAELLAGEKDSAVATAAMRQLVLRHEKSAEAHLALAQLLVRDGETEEALATVGRASGLKPDDERIAIFRARVLQRMDEVERALESLSDFVERVPDASTARMTYARILVDAERYDEALAVFERLVTNAPDDDEARFALGLLLVQTDRLDDAAHHLEQIPNASPRRDSAHFYLARIAESQQRLDDAIASYRRVRGGEHRLNAQIRVAMLLAENGDLESARRHLRGVRTTTTQELVRIQLAEGGLLMRAERYEEAMSTYDESLERLPGNTDLLYARGMLAERMDRLDVLERDMREIISRDPDNAEALNALGYTLADRTDRYEEAHELIMRAVELKPDDHYIVDSLGWVLHRMGRHEEALEHLRRALSITPDPEIAAHLGEVLWVLGQEVEAREVWNAALEESPDDKNLIEIIERFGL